MVSPLGQLLGFLDRQDVREILLQSDAVPCARIAQELRPLTRQKLAAHHLLAIVQGTPVQALIERARSVRFVEECCVVDGRSLRVAVAFPGDHLKIRFVSAQSEGVGVHSRRPRSPRSQRPSAAPRARPRTHSVPPERSLAPKGRSLAPKGRSLAPKGRSLAPKGRSLAPKGRSLAPKGRSLAPRKRSDAPVSTERPPPVACPTQPVVIQSAETRVPASLVALVQQARQREASDVHLSSGQPAQFRVAGALVPEGSVLDHATVSTMLLPLLSPRCRADLDERGYADLSTDLGAGGRVRVNVNRQREGYKGCLRLVADGPAELSALGLPPELSKITFYHQGLVVVSGPNGSGKTTTLASLVDLFNSTRPIHIITVEDPVEVLHSRQRAIVSQREVRSHTNSFFTALKAALREDPDVIAIGELRDLETVEMALSAAETGHLVIATMSTPSGARTIDRLIDMFPPSVQSQVRATLAGTLKMVISQRLVPSRDRKRRFVAAELITGNVPLWALIRDNKLYQLPSLLQRGRAYGMLRIDDSLNELVLSGKVDIEEAKRVADDPRAIGVAPAQRPTAPGAPAAPAREPAPKRTGLGALFGQRGS